MTHGQASADEPARTTPPAAETVAMIGAGGTMGFAMARNITLADGLGVDPSLFFPAVESGPLDLPYLRMKGHTMTERDFTPSFRLTLAAKDAALVTDAAWQHGVDLPLLDVDISATYLTSAPEQAA